MQTGEDSDRLSLVHAVLAMRRRITQPVGFAPTVADGYIHQGNPSGAMLYESRTEETERGETKDERIPDPEACAKITNGPLLKA